MCYILASVGILGIISLPFFCSMDSKTLSKQPYKTMFLICFILGIVSILTILMHIMFNVFL